MHTWQLQLGLTLFVLSVARVKPVAADPHSQLIKRDTQVPAVAGWVSSWGGKAHQPLYSLYDELSFLPAVLSSDGTVTWSVDGDVSVSMTPADINGSNRPTLLSVGGWSCSKYFSSSVKTDTAREKLASSIAELVVKHGFAGVDLDWEFPNGKPADASDVPGDKGDFVEVSADSQNDFTEEGNREAYSSCGCTFHGAKVKDASALVATDTLDYISIMTYEMGHHYREDTGIHAPLRSGDATPKDQTWSIEKSVKVWKDAKVPLDRIQIGLPAYGKVFTTSLTRGEALPPRQEYGGSLLYQPTNFLRDQKKLAGGEKGQIDASLYDKDPDCPETLRLKAKYGEIVEAGMPVTETSGSETGFKYYWDDTSASPYLYNPETAEFVTFDNPQSFAEKAAWARSVGLGGVKIFSVQGDVLSGDLVKAARKAVTFDTDLSSAKTNLQDAVSLQGKPLNKAASSAVGMLPECTKVFWDRRFGAPLRFTTSTDSDIDPVIVPELRRPFNMFDKTVAIVLAISTLGKTVTCMERANQQGLISGWVTAWGGNGSMALYDQYDEISFLGALTDPDGGVNMTVDGDPFTKPTFTLENMTSIEPLLSIGGWAGSQFFSKHVRDDEKRKDFAANITATVLKYGFGGVDLDWEFPNGKPDNASHVAGDRGNWCNENHPDDYENLIAFIKILRKSLTKAMDPRVPLLTAAVPFAGYLDKNQKYIEDASALVSKETLDWISIMSYEMGHHYRHWTGIHAPLHIGSKTPWDQKWSIARSVAYWHKAKIPLDKIQIGLPAYGKIFQTTLQGEAKAQLRPNPEFGGSLLYQPQEYPRVQMEVPDIWNPEDPWGTGSKLIWELDFCNTFRNQEHVKIHGFAEFIANGVLDAEGKAIPGEGLTIEYDRLTESPYIYNATSGQLITYDDPVSFEAKSRWAKKKGLKGVKIFSIQHDTVDGLLLKAAKKPWRD